MRDETHTLKFQPLQIALLRHAFSLVKKNGIIVYSTCTYAPEENEVVINSLLNSCDVKIEKIAFPSTITSSAGLLQWKNIHFHKSMNNTHRFYPHQNNTGGFFVAKLRKL